MARANDNSELWSAVSFFGYMYDSTGGLNTTLSSSEAEGSTGINIASTASGSDNDYARVGDDSNYEVVQFGTLVGSSVDQPLKSHIAYDHSSGEAVVGLQRVDLGDISDDGVQVEVQADRTRIDAATQRHAYDHNINHTNYRLTVSLENLSNENLLVALGIDESNIHGSGTTSDPNVVDWTPDDIDTIDPIHFYFQGALKNGDNVEVQAWDCRVDPSKTMAFARGQDAPAQVVFDARHIRFLRPV